MIEIDYDRYRVENILWLFSKLKPANPLLDIGCDDGQITRLIKKVLNAEHAYGIGVSESAFPLARDNGIHTILLDIDSGNLPFEDGYFQAVYCGEVIEHLNNPDHLLDEIYRVLAGGGTYIIDTPNLSSWHGRIGLLLGYQPSNTQVSAKYNVGKLVRGEYWAESEKPHHWIFTFKALKELVLIHGYRIVTASGAADSTIGFPYNVFDRICSLSPHFSTYTILMIRKPSIK